MTVELIAYTQRLQSNGTNNPLSVVEQAASVCYDSKPTEDFKIAKGCKTSGHLSVLEHINFTFHVSGISRALLAQLSRHRHISLSCRSQRYCSENKFEYENPFRNEWPSAREEFFDKIMQNVASGYRLLKEEYDARNEDARAVLPNSCHTELYLTVNARALIEMSHLRLCSRAQREIRTMFTKMKEQVSIVCPEVAKWMVPSCEVNPKYPFCPEGARCCGRHPKLADVYKPVINKENGNDSKEF